MGSPCGNSVTACGRPREEGLVGWKGQSTERGSGPGVRLFLFESPLHHTQAGDTEPVT